MAEKLTAAQYEAKAKRDPKGIAVLRAHLTGRLKGASAADRKTIRTALLRPRLLAALRNELAATYGAYAARTSQAGGEVLDFFQWLIQYLVENADKIIAIITKLIPLFV